MAYKQEPVRAPINAYGPLKEMGLIRPGKKNKNKKVYGQNKKYLTSKQKRNRQFLAPIAGAVLGTFAMDKGIRQKVGQGVKNVFQKFF